MDRRSLARVVALASALAVASNLSAQQVTAVAYGPDLFGADAELVGDVNHDGFADLLVGVPKDGTLGYCAGRVRLFNGKTSAPLRDWFGTAAGDQFGAHVAAAGDVNHDGVADVMVASVSSTAMPGSGTVRVFSGSWNAPIFTFLPNASDATFATAITAGGDANADGFVDFVISAPQMGHVTILSGMNGSLVRQIDGPNSGEMFGQSLSFVGDSDGDGADDLAIGSPSAGVVRVVSGATGATLFTMYGDAAERFGIALDDAGDVDHDGVDDLVIGVPSASANGPASGAMQVRSGRDGHVMRTIAGISGFEFGTSVGGARDVDGDGTADQVGGTMSGDAAFLYSGADGKCLASYLGSHSAPAYGATVATGGDTNGDGKADVAIGCAGSPLAPAWPLPVQIFGDCPGAITSDGVACAPPGGVAPRLDGSGCPKAGGTVTLRVTGKTLASGTGNAVLFASTTHLNAVLPNGCSWLVGGVGVQVPVLLSPLSFGASAGSITTVLPMTTPSVTIWLQALVDEGQGYGTSNALKLEVW